MSVAFFKLSIVDLRIWVRLGCTDQEKFNPQLISVNVDIAFKLPPRGTVSDRLEDTVCYSQLIGSVKAYCVSRPFNLIECVSSGVYKVIGVSLENYKSVISFINVAIHKMSPPVQDLHGGVVFTYCDAL